MVVVAVIFHFIFVAGGPGSRFWLVIGSDRQLLWRREQLQVTFLERQYPYGLVLVIDHFQARQIHQDRFDGLRIQMNQGGQSRGGKSADDHLSLSKAQQVGNDHSVIQGEAASLLVDTEFGSGAGQE